MVEQQMQSQTGVCAPLLQTLASMEDATTGAYDAALGKLGTAKSAPSMQRFRDNHKAHAETLKQWAARTGEQQPSIPTEGFKQVLQDSVAQAHTYDGVFSTLRVTEAAIRVLYNQALASPLPEDTKATLKTLLKDEEEHIDFLELATHGLPKT